MTKEISLKELLDDCAQRIVRDVEGRGQKSAAVSYCLTDDGISYVFSLNNGTAQATAASSFDNVVCAVTVVGGTAKLLPDHLRGMSEEDVFKRRDEITSEPIDIVLMSMRMRGVEDTYTRVFFVEDCKLVPGDPKVMKEFCDGQFGDNNPFNLMDVKPPEGDKTLTPEMAEKIAEFFKCECGQSAPNNIKNPDSHPFFLFPEVQSRFTAKT